MYNVRHGNAPAGTVYIGRPHFASNDFYMKGEQDRIRACAYFLEKLRTSTALVDSIRRELDGKHLACHCAPKACHGEAVLLVAAGANPAYITLDDRGHAHASEEAWHL